MRFLITDACDEPWDAMAPREGGRFCERCQTVVIDLAGLTRAQAERRVRAMGGTDTDVCVQLEFDRSGEAVFARLPPSQAPHFVGGLVLAAALTAGGCATEPPVDGQAAEVRPEVDLGPPMIPTPLGSSSAIAPLPETGPVPTCELDQLDESPANHEEAQPTPEQRALTERKQRRYMVRGRMPFHAP